jgi:hypothetical protein
MGWRCSLDAGAYKLLLVGKLLDDHLEEEEEKDERLTLK